MSDEKLTYDDNLCDTSVITLSSIPPIQIPSPTIDIIIILITTLSSLHTIIIIRAACLPSISSELTSSDLRVAFSCPVRNLSANLENSTTSRAPTVDLMKMIAIEVMISEEDGV